MQRYKNINDIKIGDRIMLDNSTNFIKDVARVKIIGEVLEILDNKLIKVAFKINGIPEDVIRNIPYYMCQ